MKKYIFSGSILMALGVILGAFGAHSLNEILTQNSRIETYQTAVLYHFIHALGILVLGVLSIVLEKKFDLAFYLMLSGIIIFSGSLYILCVTNILWLGAITPIGGLLFIISWLSLAFTIIKK